MISTPKMDKKVGLKRGYPLFICCVVGIAMYFTMILEGFYYHGTIMSIEKIVDLNFEHTALQL